MKSLGRITLTYDTYPRSVDDDNDCLSVSTCAWMCPLDIATNVLGKLGNLHLVGRILLTRSSDVPCGSTLGPVGIIHLPARSKIYG